MSWCHLKDENKPTVRVYSGRGRGTGKGHEPRRAGLFEDKD